MAIETGQLKTNTAMAAAAPAMLPKRRFSLRNSLPEVVGIPVVIIAIIVLWEVAVRVFGIRSIILPSPLAVWEALVQGLSMDPSDRTSYVQHMLVTLWEIVAGFGIGAVVGIVLALVLSQIRLLERIIHPLVVGFQSVPKIAVAPLFIIWFGFGSESKIALVSIITFFPVLVAGMAGFKSVERERLDVMRSLGASRWQTFSKLVMPGSLPYLFTGLEISLVHAMTATIVAEFLAGRSGLGVLIVQMQQVLDTASIFSVLIILGIMGWILVLILTTIRKRLVFWAPDSRKGR